MTDSVVKMDGSYTLKDAIRLAGFGPFQIILLLCLLFFHMTDAMEVLLISVLSEPLSCHWKLQSWQLVFITTALVVGMGVGAPTWGKIADIYGRRPILILSTAMIGYFGLLSAFSPSFIWFVILRSIVGVAIPGAYLAFVILTEFLPIEYKGFTLLIYSLSWPLGGIFETLIAAFVLPTLGWRYLVAFTSIPLWLCLLLVKFVPESPEYSLMTGNKAVVETTVKRMLKMNKKEIPKNFNILPQTKKVTGRFMDLVRPLRQARLTFQIWFLLFGLAFLYYGAILLVSEALRKDYNPCSDYVSYSDKETCSCKIHDWTHYKALIISSCGEFGGFVINILLLELMGRQKMLLLHMGFFSVLMLLLLTCTPVYVRYAFEFLIRSFLLGSINVASIFITESYGPEIRALAYGCSNTAYRLGVAITPTIAQVITDSSFKTAYIIYGVFGIILAISICFLPETKIGILWTKFQKFNKKSIHLEKVDKVPENA